MSRRDLAIAAGLFLRSANARGAVAGMVLGSASGLYSYFAIGFYVAALVGAAVSLACVVLASLWRPAGFDWSRLQETPPERQDARS